MQSYSNQISFICSSPKNLVVTTKNKYEKTKDKSIVQIVCNVYLFLIWYEIIIINFFNRKLSYHKFLLDDQLIQHKWLSDRKVVAGNPRTPNFSTNTLAKIIACI